MLKKIQKTFLKLLEKELMLVLAVLMLALATFWVRADTDSLNLVFIVYPEGGTITVTYPNGGEIWAVNTAETITWTTLGPVNNVKIELQRESGGVWEELIDSTTDDGEFPWVVTVPATSTALIKITKVGDVSVTDTSDAVFAIKGGGGGIIYNPAIDTVIPREFSNATDVDMIITGFNFEWGAKIWLDDNYLKPNYVWPSEISVTSPANFPIGEYMLCVHNLSGGRGCYHLPIIIYEDVVIIEPEPEPEPKPEPEEDIIPSSTGGEEETPISKIPIIGPILDFFRPLIPQLPIDHYKPIDEVIPSKDVIVFTDTTEQCPTILFIWVLILLTLIKMFTRKFPSIWLAWLLILIAWVSLAIDSCSVVSSLWILIGITLGLFIWDHYKNDANKPKLKVKH